MSQIANTATKIHRPERSRIELSDPAEIRQFLDGLYGVKLRMREKREPMGDGRLTHARMDVGPFTIDDIRLPGEFEAAPDPVNKVMAVWATSGRIAGQCDGLTGAAKAGGVTMMSQHDLPHHALTDEATVTAVLMDPALVASVATGVPSSQAPLPVRFAKFRPVDASASRLWKDTVSYVRDSVLGDDAMVTPLVLGNAARLLAAVTLATFPNKVTLEPSPYDRTDAKPVLLKRAVEYIESNATNDISLADIANAVHVTPRAVQYMFRRHLETTPLQYLRRLRLHQAHQDLLASDRAHDSVTAIAAKWGFMHTGRFAVLYRQVYGQSPHTTLRG